MSDGTVKLEVDLDGSKAKKELNEIGDGSKSGDKIEQSFRNASQAIHTMESGAKEAKEAVEDIGEEAQDAAKKVEGLADEFEGLGDSIPDTEIPAPDIPEMPQAPSAPSTSPFSDFLKSGLIVEGAKAIASGLMEAYEASKELNTGFSMLSETADATGANMDTAKEAFRQMAAISGEVDSSFEATSNLLKAGFDENGLLQAVEALSGAVVQFPDTLKFESLADSLQETLATGEATGQFAELLGRLGISTDEFNAKLAQCTTEAEKQDLALQTLSEAGLNEVGAAYQEANGPALQMAEAQLKMQEALGTLVNTVLPLVAPAFTGIANTLANAANGFQSMVESGNPLLYVLEALAIAAGIFAIAINIGTILGLVSKGFNTLKTAVLGVNAAMKANPIMLVVSLLAGLVAALITAYNTNEDFRNMVNAAWAAVKQKASEVFGAIKGFISDVISKVSEVGSELAALPGKALTWGKDMIQSFINGITGKIGDLTRTVSGVATKVKEFLGFSCPDKGPLSDADEYGGDFMDLFSGEIDKNAYKAERAAKNAAAKVAEAMESEEMGVRAKLTAMLPNIRSSAIGTISGMTPAVAGAPQFTTDNRLNQLGGIMGMALNAMNPQREIIMKVNGREFARATVDDYRYIESQSPQVRSD